MRRMLFVLFFLALVVGGAFLALHFYLHSAGAARQVAERIEAIYGAPVQVGGIEVGLNSSSLEDLKLYDQPAAGQKATTRARR